MAEMADMMDTLRALLGENADEKIGGVIDMLSQKGAEEQSEKSESSSDNLLSPENLMRMQKIISSVTASDDDRSRLLLSLKPYMRPTRQKTIDSAIKLMNAAQLSKLLDLQ